MSFCNSLTFSEFEPRQKLNQSQVSFDNLMGYILSVSMCMQKLHKQSKDKIFTNCPATKSNASLIIGHSMKFNFKFQLTFLGSCNCFGEVFAIFFPSLLILFLLLYSKRTLVFRKRTSDSELILIYGNYFILFILSITYDYLRKFISSDRHPDYTQVSLIQLSKYFTPS